MDLMAQLRKHNAGRKVLAKALLWQCERRRTPRRLILEPISACNYRCPKCIYPEMTRSRTGFDDARLASFLERWRHAYGPFKTIEFTGAGEPLLLRQFPDIVESAARVMPETRLVTTSNLSLLDSEAGRKLIRAGLREWQISLDSADSAEYARMTGVQSVALSEVVANIRLLWNLMAENPSHQNRLTILAHRPYDAEYTRKIAEIEELVAGICHSVAASPYQSLNGRKPDESLAFSERSLYRSDKYSLPCGYLWDDLVVVNDGTVRVCCSDMFDSPVSFGNVFTDTPKQIVDNIERRRYQRAMAQGQLQGLYLCETCHAPKA